MDEEARGQPAELHRQAGFGERQDQREVPLDPVDGVVRKGDDFEIGFHPKHAARSLLQVRERNEITVTWSKEENAVNVVSTSVRRLGTC